MTELPWMVADTQTKFSDFNACSFDKGFHSPANQRALKEPLQQVTRPRKGKLSQQAKAEESTEAFVQARRAHPAVESAINALEVHGLDKCPDHGLHGFKCYVALAVVTRNIHRVGDILWHAMLNANREGKPPCWGELGKLLLRALQDPTIRPASGSACPSSR